MKYALTNIYDFAKFGVCEAFLMHTNFNEYKDVSFVCECNIFANNFASRVRVSNIMLLGYCNT
jgi:hypothetical protein